MTPRTTRISTVEEAKKLLVTNRPEARSGDTEEYRDKAYLTWNGRSSDYSLCMNARFFDLLLPTWLEIGSVSVTPAWRTKDNYYESAAVQVNPEGIRTSGSTNTGNLLDQVQADNRRYREAQQRRVQSLMQLCGADQTTGREEPYTGDELSSRLEQMEGVLYYNLAPWFNGARGADRVITITFMPTIHTRQAIGVTTPLTYKVGLQGITGGIGSHPHLTGSICFGNVANLVRTCFERNDLHTLITLLDKHALSYDGGGALTDHWTRTAFNKLAKLIDKPGGYNTSIGWDRWDRETARYTSTGERVSIEAVLQEKLKTKADLRTILRVAEIESGTSVEQIETGWGVDRGELTDLVKQVEAYKDRTCRLCGGAGSMSRACAKCNAREDYFCRCEHGLRRTANYRDGDWTYRPWYSKTDRGNLATTCAWCQKENKVLVVVQTGGGNRCILCSVECHNAWFTLNTDSRSGKSKTFQEVLGLAEQLEKGELVWEEAYRTNETEGDAEGETEEDGQDDEADMRTDELTVLEAAPLRVRTAGTTFTEISQPQSYTTVIQGITEAARQIREIREE